MASTGESPFIRSSGVEGMTDGVYGAAAPDAAVKVILQRWFGEVA